MALLCCVSMMAQNSVNLRLNLEKNKVYRLSSMSEQTIIQTVNGNQQTVETTSNYAASIKMIDATPSFIIAEVHIDTMITKSNTMGKTINMSSASEGNIKSSETADIMSSFMNKLSKSAIYAKIDFTGKTIEIVNQKMLSEMVVKDTSSLTVTGATREALRKQAEGIASDNSLKTLVNMFTNFLPGREIKVGETWNNTETTNSGGMSLEIASSYHLDGVTGNSANITAESDIKAPANAVPMEQGVAKITYDDVKGLSKMTISVDTGTGLLVEVKGKTHIAGNLGVSGPGFSLQIPMDINSTSKLKAIK